MKKLYKEISGVLHYDEAWADGTSVVRHFGKVGERGTTEKVRRFPTLSDEAAIDQALAESIQAGFEEINIDLHSTLVIEFTVEGHGTVADLDKRHSLESRMNETLGWVGLGHCDGGSIGSGSMEVFCYVVEPQIALKIVREDLNGSSFSDYSRLFIEETEEIS